MIPLIFSTASLLFCGFFFVYFHRYIRRRTSHENILAECADAVARLEAQIDAVTDRDAQLVEERIKSLKKLLEDVDRRISLLSRIEDQRKPTALYNSLGDRMRFSGPGTETPLPPDAAAFPDPGPVPAPVLVSAPTASAMVNTVSQDRVSVQTDPADTLPAASTPVSGPAKDPSLAPAPEPDEDTRPLVERVAELDRAGFSPELIASRLGVSVSEAELAVTVFRHSRQGNLS
jgi:hypothetical protein